MSARIFVLRFSLSALLAIAIVSKTLGAQSTSETVLVSVSVMFTPFINLTGNPDDDWIGRGTSESIRAEIESRMDLRNGLVLIGSQDFIAWF